MNSHRAQSGFSLVELMIAMTIGLMITLVIGELFVGNKRTYGVQEENARVQESARFALGMLERQIRMAGFKRSDCDVAVCVFDAGPNTVIIGTNDADVNLSDRLRVQFFGSDNAAGTDADGSVVDCVGTSKRSTERVDDTYLILADPANNNEPTLYCQRAGESIVAPITATPLIPGIESMQILYGEDSISADGLKSADRYVPANFAGPPALDWDKVVAVKVSLVFRSEGNAIPSPDSRRFNHFGSQYAPGDVPPAGDLGSVFNSAGATLDLRLRRMIEFTVGLRNRIN